MKGFDNMGNPYWENINELARQQRIKGMKKYKTGLEDNYKSTVDKIQYIEEELIDALMYLEWLKDGMRNGE